MTRHAVIRNLAYVFLLLGGDPAPAQSSSFQFDRLGLEQGLSQSAATALLQDRRGYLWVATEDGLNRFDGYGFTVFRHDPTDPNSLSDNYVIALFESADGALWAGTSDGGLNKYDPASGTFVSYRHDPADSATLSHDRVAAIAQAPTGDLWIGTHGGGLNRLDPETGRITRFRHDPSDPLSLPHDHVWALLVDHRGRLWAGTGGGLARLEASGFTVYPNVSGVMALCEDAEGQLWAGTFGGGLGRLGPSGGSYITYRHDAADPASLSSDAVTAVGCGRRGDIWAGTWGSGLNRLDATTGRVTRYRHADGDPASLPDDYVNAVYESPDPSGLIWVGTSSGGLARFNPAKEQFRLHRHDPSEPSSLVSNYVTAFAETPDGALWVGTRDGLSRQDPHTGRFTHYVYEPTRRGSLSASYVRALLTDRQGTLWVGTAAGLNRYDAATHTFTPFPHVTRTTDDGDANRVYALVEDHGGLLWVGTRMGLYAFDPHTGTFVLHVGSGDGLSSAEVVALAVAADGAIWASTTGSGLNRFHPATGRVTVYRHDPDDPATLSNDRILGIHPAGSTSGPIWLATYSGLNHLDPATGRVTRYGEAGGLPSGVVYGVLEDDASRLWLPSNRGLTRFDPASGDVRTYDVSDGLQSNEFNLGANYRAGNGDLVAGGVRGFNRFSPEAIVDNPHIPPVVLTRFRIFDDNVEPERTLDGAIRLTHRDAYFAFEFASLDFANPARNQYAYKLEGFDESWHHAGTRRYVSYTNLPGGRYVFRVRGSNNDGVWNEEGLAVPLIIAPPYWETWWFRLALVLSVLGLGFGGAWGWQHARLRLLERSRDEIAEAKRRLSEAREQERLHLARELHDGPLQDLYTANLNYTANLAVTDGPHSDPDEVDALRDAIRRVSGTLRSICGELRPPTLGPFGLSAALRSHIDRFRAAHPDLVLETDLMADGQQLPEDVRVALFRIAQEALRNAARHSGAGFVRLAFHLDAEEAVLEVRDDGTGFAPPRGPLEGAREGRFGLLGMYERAESIGGHLEIKSLAGFGTSLRVVVPVPESAAESDGLLSVAVEASGSPGGTGQQAPQAQVV